MLRIQTARNINNIKCSIKHIFQQVTEEIKVSIRASKKNIKVGKFSGKSFRENVNADVKRLDR